MERIVWISDCNDWGKIVTDFEQIWNISHCIGAIDRKHIAKKRPAFSGSNIITKGFSACFWLQYAILYKFYFQYYNFTAIDVGQYGSNNVSGVLLVSKMGKYFEKDSFHVPAPEKAHDFTKQMLLFLVGDKIFP